MKTKSILIIEDDIFISDLYVKVFKDAGYEVATALDGEVALQKLKEEEYSIILLDIMIPKISGIDVLKKLKDINFPARNIPVYVTTNLGQEDIVDQAFKLGADGYMIKSQLTPHEVLKEIEEFLAKKQVVPTV